MNNDNKHRINIRNSESAIDKTNNKKKIKADCFLFILEDLNFITKKKKER